MLKKLVMLALVLLLLPFVLAEHRNNEGRPQSTKKPLIVIPIEVSFDDFVGKDVCFKKEFKACLAKGILRAECERAARKTCSQDIIASCSLPLSFAKASNSPFECVEQSKSACRKHCKSNPSQCIVVSAKNCFEVSFVHQPGNTFVHQPVFLP